ncbi:MAG: hypothetical protein QXJ59_04425 [Thermofilaceae archaeon]
MRFVRRRVCNHLKLLSSAHPPVDVSAVYEEVVRIREAVKDIPVIKEAVFSLNRKVDTLLSLAQSRARRVSLEDFEKELDRALSITASPAGWAELEEVARLVCPRLGITRDEFYERLTELIETSPTKYELSPGGVEGVVLRGKLYGLIRRR